MSTRTAVIDTADWVLAVPLEASGNPLNFSGTSLSIALTPIFGGPPIARAQSADGSLTFVPATADTLAYFAINLRVKDRTWRVARQTAVDGDILRHPDPGNPLYTEWLGRVSLTVAPGSGSTGILTPAQAPVLTDIQPYDGRIVTAPMALGIQGATGAPRYQIITDASGTLAIDLAKGEYARAALNGPAALSISGWPTNFDLGRLTLELDIAAGAILTGYPSGTIWQSGAPPVLSAGPAKDLLMFTSIDGGATVFGHIIGLDYRSAT